MQSLNFLLTGTDGLSPVLNHAGHSSSQLHHQLNDDMNGNALAVRRFTQDANGRLHDLRGRYVSVADAQRMMAGGLPDLTRRLGDMSSAGGSAGASGIGLAVALKGVAVVAGLSLLPALGALVPMLAGIALVAGTVKVGFAGVGEAMAAAGDKKEFAKRLKELSPEARTFTKALVGLKKEFAPIGREVQKALLPGFTAAVKAASPVVKILGKSMTEMGDVFGDAARGVSRLLRDSGFQDDLQTNLKLGTGFIRDMTSSMGPFIRSLLDFGAASGPTLKAFSSGISGLLGKGLPDMFTGLQRGIPGAARMLDGLFSMVNNLLGGLGRLSGEMGRTLGPVFEQTFKILGDIGTGAMDILARELHTLTPLFTDLTFGLKSVRDLGALIGPTLIDTGNQILGAFLPVSDGISKTVGPLTRLNRIINDNKIQIMEGARIFGGAMIDMVTVAVQAAPKIIHAWGLVGVGILGAIGVAVSASAKLFGWVPGIGGKLKAANKSFNDFRDNYIGGLGKAETIANQFAAATVPKLSAGKLKMDINNWSSQIEVAKDKLKTLPPSRQAALKATIRDLEAKVRSARNQLNGLDGKTATTWIYTNVQTRYVPSTTRSGSAHDAVGATGGLFTGKDFKFRGQHLAAGGLVNGPGTPTSDSVFAPWLSRDEFVVNAKQTAKHLPLLKAINSDSLGLGSLSSSVGPTGAAAAQGLAGGMAGSVSLVASAARKMAGAVVTGIRAELEIASPSKKTKALAKDVGAGFIAGLTGSRDKIKSVAKDLAGDIKTAFSGRKESSLLRYVDKQTDKLLAAAKKRDAIAAKIAEAKQYAAGLTTNARSSAGLSNLGLEEGHVTAGGIRAGLQQKLAQIKQFSSYISTLAKRGLNKSLLRQVLDMGPIDGYAYASALVGADKMTFSQINSAQKQIDSQTATLGRKGADMMYDSGKNASKGFLSGLQSQQKDIENLMLKIAKGMQASIKKALGIKSPSTVMARLGAYSTQGLAQGLVAGIPVLDRALDTVSGRVAATQPVMGRPAVATGAGGGMTVHITIQGALDTAGVARQVDQLLSKYRRGNGGASYNFT